MTTNVPDAYCFFQKTEPRAPLVARFERDDLLHAVRGALNVEIGARKWLLLASFAAWVPAETEIWVVLDRPVTSCSILAKPGFATGFPAKPVGFQMSRVAPEMALHCRRWGPLDPHPPEASVFFSALLSACAALVGTTIDVAQLSSDDPRLSRAIAFTDAHLHRNLTANEVAAGAGLSERSMQRMFSTEIGASWSQTLTWMRMIRAIELLTTEKMPVTQVAGACGYASMSAFNRSFREYAQKTPTEYRKQL